MTKPSDCDADESARIGFSHRARGRVDRIADKASARFERTRARVRIVDIAMRVYKRDRVAAGTLLGSALALRLFLFFVPLVLFAIGLAGILGRHAGVDGIASDVGMTGSLAADIDDAFEQGTTTPWLAMGIGLFGIATTGRSLTRALVLSSALSWQLGGHQKTRLRVIGVVTGLIVGIALIAAVLNRIRDARGLAGSSLAFVVVAAIYVILWSTLYLALPRGTPDPGAALPGASVVALVLTFLQAVTQLFLPNQISGASALYGTVGVAVAFLGWFFIVGRTMAFSFAVNAVVYEEIGSISRFVFGLPALRVLPRRVPALARFFDLDGPFRRDRAENEVEGPTR